MDTATVLGRVGGLAVAMGAGAAVFAASPSAWADRTSPDPADNAAAVPHRASAEGAKPQAVQTRSSTKSSPAARAVARPQVHAGAAAKQTRSAAITVNPATSWTGGLLLGSLNATSAAGRPLTFDVLSPPSLGGKVAWQPTPAGSATQPDVFSYVPYMTTLTTSGQTEDFKVLVAEVTPFDTVVKKIPIVGLFADPVIKTLHQLPLVSVLLAPLIGAATTVTVTESPYLTAAGRPVDFTYKMPSFDGTLISLNYFPAANVAAGAVPSAPTVLNGPDLGFPGNTNVWDAWDPSLVNIVPGLSTLRTDANPFPGGYSGGGGYNVITWDPRGEWASGGVMQLDNPNFEGRDVSSIISWATSTASVAQSQIATDPGGDPYIGMVGGSYGGGIQFTVAGTPDKRIDAIVPSIAWNTLNQSLYPSQTFKTVIGSELLMALVATKARINPQIYLGIATGALVGWLSNSAQALLTNAGPGVLTNNITAATLIQQGTPDILFELNAAMTNGQIISTANPTVPLKTTWFCGGHGVCLLPQSEQSQQGQVNLNDTLKWLDQYVAQSGSPADAIPVFQWFDQAGQYHSSGTAPFDPSFNSPTPLTYQGSGKGLLLVPLLGGSGPSKAAVPPDKPTTFSTAFALASGSKARNAVNLAVAPPVGTDIAGTPTLSFTYKGFGTSRAVYAQLVDNATGNVVGNIVTPVPVTLDGREHTVNIPMAPLAYSVGSAADSLTLQIASSALPYANMTAWGFIDIGTVNLAVPTVA